MKMPEMTQILIEIARINELSKELDKIIQATGDVYDDQTLSLLFTVYAKAMYEMLYPITEVKELPLSPEIHREVIKLQDRIIGQLKQLARCTLLQARKV